MTNIGCEVRISMKDWRAYANDKDLYGNAFISVARGGNVGRRIAPQDVVIKNHGRHKPGSKPE